MSIWRGFFTWLFAMLVTAGIMVVASCKSDPVPTVLQALDTTPDASGGGTGQPFDRNNILDTNSFTDDQSLDRDAVQKFLSKTPYSRSSFLETYQSNGIRAADAIVAAARNHHINPLVFLVLTETTQGLIGARDYVFPPERIEYIFDCGCYQKTNCAADLAGYDRQLDCLGGQLESVLNDVKANKHANSGWGIDQTSTTLDGAKVSPANEATAVLYDRNPRLDINGPTGQWVFWNVWQVYAAKMNYFGPLGASGGKQIGDPCVHDNECSDSIPDAFCAQPADGYPDGMCVFDCTQQKTCPSTQGGATSFCTQFKDGAFCAPTCNIGAGGGCRNGYTCIHVKGANGDSNDICSAQPATK
jgi:hypothetical protein